MIRLPEKNILITVVCPHPEFIHLFFSSSRLNHNTFMFGDDGVINVLARRAIVDGKSAQLSYAESGGHSGVMALPLRAGNAMRFMDSVEIKGQVAAVLLTLSPRTHSGVITDRVHWQGNIQIELETSE